MKLIALDVGTKRIGVAKADSAVRIAVPFPAVEVDGNEFKKIASLARAWDINSFVLGLPRNSQGEETEQSRYVRSFAKDLKRALPEAKIAFQDESLTSVEAEKRLKGRKKSYKKGDIDSEAATIILQDFLERHAGKSTTKASSAKKRQSVKANKPHRIFTTLFIVILLLGAAAGGLYYFYQQNIQAVFTDLNCNDPEDATSSACKSILFSVDSGASVNDVAIGLENAGLIRNALVFQVYYRLNYNGQMIKTGDYDLNQVMTPADIIERLIRGEGGNVFSFTVLPGENIFDIKKKLSDAGYSDEEIEKAFKADYNGKYSWIFEGRPEGAGLEGYLYGDTYEFFVTDDVETVIERMLTEMASVLEENKVQEKFAEQGLNLYQGITLASIVQKEANNKVDYAKVAQVFYNRLHENMTLGSDVTTIYAVDLVDPDRTTYVTEADKLAIDSPYNTRLHPGLPYGPISNPGIDAILATATPDSSMSNYLFFLTGDDGLMYYSTTDEEHERNIIEHCAELCNVAL